MIRFNFQGRVLHRPRVAAAIAVAGLAACLAAPLASAHAVWFAQHGGRLAFIFGLGADDLDTVKRLPHVTNVAGYDSSFKPMPTHLKADGPLVVVDSGPKLSVVTAVMDYGLWSKPPGDAEWVNKGRDGVPNAIVSEKNYKFALHIVGPVDNSIPALPHQTLEVVPVGKIPALKDQPLELRVLFHGKPQAGVQILRDFLNDPDGEVVKSGADGTVTIRVRNQGLNVISATYDGPPENPKQEDHVEYEATLSFVLPHKPE